MYKPVFFKNNFSVCGGCILYYVSDLGSFKLHSRRITKLLSCLTVGKRRWMINLIDIKLNNSQGDRVDEANKSRRSSCEQHNYDRIRPRSHANTYEWFFVPNCRL